MKEEKRKELIKALETTIEELIHNAALDEGRANSAKAFGETELALAYEQCCKQARLMADYLRVDLAHILSSTY